MVSKDTIDKLNRLEFFYWCKPTKIPEVLKQDKEQVEKDFALIRKDLEILEIIKDKNVECWYLTQCEDLEEYNDYKLKKDGTYFTLTQEEFDLIKSWLSGEE